LRSNTDRVRPLLGHRGVVDHQYGIAATDEPVCLNKQLCLHRRRIPHPGRHEMVQLIIPANRKPLCHRLNALAITRTDQSRHVQWTHPSPRFVAQPIQKRLQPAFEFIFPVQRVASHGRPSKKPTTHESLKH